MRGMKTLRLSKNWTQTQLAEVSGVSVNVIKALEKNVRSTDRAQIDTLARICKALGCKISEVLTDDELIDIVEECEAN